VKSGVLFINGHLGRLVLSHVLKDSDLDIKLIVLNHPNKRSRNFHSEVEQIVSSSKEKIPITEWGNNDFIEHHELLAQCSFGISALFGHLIPESIINRLSKGIINLHPSLLPLGKGADPVPWAIISSEKQGATIHLVSDELDGGAILSQKEIHSNLAMNAGEIYELCIASLFTQLQELLHPWLEGDILPSAQSRISKSVRKSNELDSLRTLHASEVSTFSSFIRRLQALTYSDRRLPFFRDEVGNLWEIDIKLHRIENEKGRTREREI
jgi:methionyl-tRNA formyltransferase